MGELKDHAVLVARRVVKSAAAVVLHYSGASDALSALQRRAVGGRRVLVLSYHRVVEDWHAEAKRSLSSMNVSQATFRKHLQVLRETHDIVTLDLALEVLQGRRPADRDVAVITFDDGYHDVYEYAYPVLRELGAPAIIYVPSGFVGTRKRLGHDRLFDALERMQQRGLTPLSVGIDAQSQRILLDAGAGRPPSNVALEVLIAKFPTGALLKVAGALEARLGLAGAEPQRGQMPVTWDQLREMAAHGIETGAHTAEHTVLTHLDVQEARAEIALCKSVIEKGTGSPVRHFAYCNGFYSAGVAQALKAEGFVSAVTTEDCANVPGVDLFALKRKVLWEGSSVGLLGTYSHALTACQMNDSFGVLSLQKPVMGAVPTRSDAPEAWSGSQGAHSS